ncbi:hypothetical protein IE81DRAFT_198209 [Ceraceosorus guamensis]|uniref:Zn(2)-C6 fungal-type domain-containing protein n=1 Tax=Ceraceosorus guamensis TaxID=1522189 RepID=A0A316VTX6_9BASI|nr:hypothetical protein IE81DRAFT_198209 [Ceraceosorus guamensis]PWN40962.1 hypothetical protein IE81DRAFT_198209 [Ceraceosorus guamensis]
MSASRKRKGCAVPDEADGTASEHPSSTSTALSRRGRSAPRTSNACDPCRRSRLKCNGQRPTCARCLEREMSSRCIWPTRDGRSERGSQRRGEETRARSPHTFTNQPHPGAPSLDLLANTAADNATSSMVLPSRLGALAPHSANSSARRMWFESALSCAPPAPSSEVDPAGVDWTSFGVAPSDLSKEMIDALTGRIGFISNQSAASDPQRANSPSSSTGLSRASKQKGDNADPVVRLQYFRLLGATSITPGVKKISLELRLTPSVRKALFANEGCPSDVPLIPQRLDLDSLVAVPGLSSTASRAFQVDVASAESAGKPELSASCMANQAALFDGDMPAEWVLDELVPLFFVKLGDHFPCLNSDGLMGRLRARRRQALSMLVNAICALAARYSEHPTIVHASRSRKAHTYGVPFAEKARGFLATSLSVPSRATTLAFLLLAWEAFACNLDSAFWNYAGMAQRMAIDLGIHQAPHSTAQPRDLEAIDFIDDSLLFWSVYQMDRALSLGTGRPASIKDSEVTCALPEPDLTTCPVFAHHLRLVRLGGMIAEVINAALQPLRARGENEAMSTTETASRLDELEDHLVDAYEALPSQLKLSASNFRASREKHVFLEMHLLYHSLLFVLNRTPVASYRNTVGAGENKMAYVVRRSAQRCAEIVAMDEAADLDVLVCVPMANQSLYQAGCAELDERKSTGSDHQNSAGLTRSVKHFMADNVQRYHRFVMTLERMSMYWDGISWIQGVLFQKQRGFADTDLVELAVGTDSMVSERELVSRDCLDRHGDNVG